MKHILVTATLTEAGIAPVDRIAMRQFLERLDAEPLSELVEKYPRSHPGVNDSWPTTRHLTENRRVSVFKAAGAGTIDALKKLPRAVTVALERAGIESLPVGSAALAEKLTAAGIDSTTRLAIKI